MVVKIIFFGILTSFSVINGKTVEKFKKSVKKVSTSI